MLNIRKQTRVKTHDYLLKGLIYCHECRNKMYCSSRHLANGIRYYFRCKTSTSPTANIRCNSHSVRMDYVENIILNFLYSLLKKYHNPILLEEISKKYLYNYFKDKNIISQLNTYTEKYQELTHEIDNLYSDRISGIIEEDDFKRIYKNIKQTQNQILLNLTHLKQSNYIIQKKNSILSDIKNKFEENFVFEKKYLTYFIKRIEIDDSKKMYIYCNFNNSNSL